jgi:hypothetical protein
MVINLVIAAPAPPPTTEFVTENPAGITREIPKEEF